jgi:hypothetical protein
MSTYKPPFARMRQIKRDAPVRGGTPVNVEDAIDRLPAVPMPVFVVEEPEQPPAEEPAVTVTQPEPEPVEAVASQPVAAPLGIKFNPQAKKADLLAIATAAGLAVDDTMTKAQIIAALQAVP